MINVFGKLYPASLSKVRSSPTTIFLSGIETAEDFRWKRATKKGRTTRHIPSLDPPSLLIQFFDLLLRRPTPASPAPRRRSVEGSGIAEEDWITPKSPCVSSLGPAEK
jgi:hypothetical protein